MPHDLMQEDFFKMSERIKIIGNNKRLFSIKHAWERFIHFLLDRLRFNRFRKRRKVLDDRYLRTTGEGSDNGSNRLIHICNIKPPR